MSAGPEPPEGRPRDYEIHLFDGVVRLTAEEPVEGRNIGVALLVCCRQLLECDIPPAQRVYVQALQALLRSAA